MDEGVDTVLLVQRGELVPVEASSSHIAMRLQVEHRRYPLLLKLSNTGFLAWIAANIDARLFDLGDEEFLWTV